MGRVKLLFYHPALEEEAEGALNSFLASHLNLIKAVKLGARIPPAEETPSAAYPSSCPAEAELRAAVCSSLIRNLQGVGTTEGERETQGPGRPGLVNPLKTTGPQVQPCLILHVSGFREMRPGKGILGARQCSNLAECPSSAAGWLVHPGQTQGLRPGFQWLLEQTDPVVYISAVLMTMGVRSLKSRCWGLVLGSFKNSFS